MIRACGEEDFEAVLAVINAAAEAYRGVIPADRWRDPYMPREELAAEIAAGVRFHGWFEHGRLVGVMGLQERDDVCLIRHAYVVPARQRRGVGGRLLAHLEARSARPVLVGTWTAARWAVRFYERHGYRRVPAAEKDRLLRRYWNVPERQIETSVVLRDARR